MPAMRQSRPGSTPPRPGAFFKKKVKGWDSVNNRFFTLTIRRPGRKADTVSSRAFVEKDGKFYSVVFTHLNMQRRLKARPITALNDKFIFKGEDGSDITMNGAEAFFLLRGTER